MEQWLDGQMDGRTNAGMDLWIDNVWMDGWTMFLSHTNAIEASKNDDFPTNLTISTKALGTDRRTDGWIDGHTLLYRDAIAASKKRKNEKNNV